MSLAINAFLALDTSELDLRLYVFITFCEERLFSPAAIAWSRFCCARGSDRVSALLSSPCCLRISSNASSMSESVHESAWQ